MDPKTDYHGNNLSESNSSYIYSIEPSRAFHHLSSSTDNFVS